MEAETTIKYPFGETPEEVIRERHEWLLSPEGLKHRVLRFDGDLTNATPVMPTDALLTVLDALLEASKQASSEDYPDLPDDVPFKQNTRHGQLRIQVLAALGIDES